MQTVLYAVWFLVPGFFLLAWLWAVLEKLSGKPPKGSSNDRLRQFFFVLACVLVAILIDRNILRDLVASFAPDFLPLGFFQTLLLPAVLYVGALIVGPSKKILISAAPRPSERKKRK